VINEILSRKYFAQGSPLGKRITLAGTGYSAEIVGVARDAKLKSLRQPSGPMIYFPALQRSPDRFDAVEVRSIGVPDGLAGAVREAVQAIDRRLLVGVKRMTQQMDDSLLRERTLAILSSFFGVAALLLACVGLFGLISYSVARRRREIAIRMALGARATSVLTMVMREMLLVLVAGLLAGVLAATMATRILSATLFGLSTTDPKTFAMAALVLVGFLSLPATSQRGRPPA
jgi:ABC-type antimicrobial peptide transport system permease subunit